MACFALKAAYVICVLSVFGARAAAIVVKQCEGNSLSLSCPSASRISIISANYGRTAGPETCPHNSIRTTECQYPESLRIVGNLCNGHTSCSIAASNNVFGDPCVGTYKYLEVDYVCENETGKQWEQSCENGTDCMTERSCEGGTLSISCPTRSRINIISANYGRTAGSETCPHSSIQTTQCFSSDSLKIVHNLCNGRRHCLLAASNDVFGDPCFGTYKYLEVVYTCERETDLQITSTCQNRPECMTKHICEGGIFFIECTGGARIDIIGANYGRNASSEICDHSSIKTTECFSSESFRTVRNLCNGHTSCSLTASNDVFGDPCMGTYKYLEVNYTCKRNTPEGKVARICEGRSLHLRCPSQSPDLMISKAMYGRQVPGTEFCPHRDIQTTNCLAQRSLATVQQACEGRSSCSVHASNQIFGDPCPGTYKYLEVEFRCDGRVHGHQNIISMVENKVHLSSQKFMSQNVVYNRAAGSNLKVFLIASVSIFLLSSYFVRL